MLFSCKSPRADAHITALASDHASLVPLSQANREIAGKPLELAVLDNMIKSEAA